MGVFFIPLLTQRETYVKCPRCNSARLTDLTFDELVACPPDELDRHLHHRVSLIVKSMAVASLFFFCIPFVGIGLGIVGLVGSRRAGGWIKVVSIIGIVLGTLATVGMIAESLISK
jgi:hypothetical protein